MRQEILAGVERRRRWSDEQKRRILAEVGIDGATVSDVARRHDLSRQHIYQWRSELRRKAPGCEAQTVFLPVSVCPDAETADDDAAEHVVEIGLANGRCLRFGATLPEPALRRLIRAAEGA